MSASGTDDRRPTTDHRPPTTGGTDSVVGRRGSGVGRRPSTRLRALIGIGITLAAAAGAIRLVVRPTVPRHGGTSGSAAVRASGTSPDPATHVLSETEGNNQQPTTNRPADDRARQIIALTQYLARHPDDVRARFQLAELYFKLKDYDRSLTELRVLERRHPKDANVYLRQAVVLKYAGDTDRAEASIRHALALQPSSDLAREWLGEIYLDQARYHQALELFNACLKQRPNSYFALLGESRALEQLLLSRHPIPLLRIIEPVEKAVQLNPGNPEGLATLARLTFTYQHRPDEAERLALRAAALDPEGPRPYVILSQIALSRPPTPENLRQVGEYAYQAGLRDLRDPRPPYFIGRVFLQQNAIDRAIKAFERSLALGPMPEAVSQLAVAYRRAGNTERADHYATIFQRYNDRLERRNTLLALREREPQEVRHLYALADLYLDAEQPDTAESWLEEAKRLRPSDPRYGRAMARVRTQRRKGGHGPMLPMQ